MTDQPVVPDVPPRTDQDRRETGASAPSDAVGRPVACGDIVSLTEGAERVHAVVQRVEGQRLVLQRGYDRRAVVDAGAVVVMQRVPARGTGKGSAL